MSPWRLEAKRVPAGLSLGLDARQLAWLRHPPSGQGGVVFGAHDNIPQALAGVAAETQVDLIAANDIALHWLQAPPSRVASFQELQLVAGARCAHLYGGAPQDWWVTGDWSASRTFVCAALPQSVVRPLQEQLAARKLQVSWHTAWSLICRVKAAAFPSDGWSALRSPRRLVLWHCSAGQVDCLSTLAVDEKSADAQVAGQALQQMQVESSRGDDFLPGPLHWLRLGEANSVQERPDIQPIAIKLPATVPASTSEASAALGLGCLLAGVSR